MLVVEESTYQKVMALVEYTRLKKLGFSDWMKEFGNTSAYLREMDNKLDLIFERK